MNDDSPLPTCHLCGHKDLQLAAEFAAFQRVTSDCRPWPAGGSLARCRACGLVQTVVEPKWQAEADQIYASYAIYHQSGGKEQNIFPGAGGIGKPRSDELIGALCNAVKLPSSGRLLDIGCGNGSFLSAWSRLLAGWSLCGSEVSEKYKSQVESILGVERLFTGDVEEIPGQFDIVSLVHVLEHIPSPVAFLQRVRKKLKPGGVLLVEVPDCAQNYFMLLVADHCSHFSPPLLAGVVASAGFEVIHATNSWVAKEATVVARPRPGAVDVENPTLSAADSQRVFANCQRLLETLQKAQRAAQDQPFGLFGTAISATWVDAQTNQAARFFVDEDQNRIGKTHLGRPILAPTDVPFGATVFVPLPEPLAGQVAGRLNSLNRDLTILMS
jgi:SAM-dependent methyltransferase